MRTVSARHSILPTERQLRRLAARHTNGIFVRFDNVELSSLPTPTREGYTFGGWYTAAADGTEVTTETVFTGDTTIYAHWTQNVIPPTLDPVDNNSNNNNSNSDNSAPERKSKRTKKQDINLS